VHLESQILVGDIKIIIIIRVASQPSSWGPRVTRLLLISTTPMWGISIMVRRVRCIVDVNSVINNRGAKSKSCGG